MSIKDYYHKAKDTAGIVNTVMVDELNLQPPSAFYLDANGRNAWLIAAFDTTALKGRIASYINRNTLHQLSTALSGKPVILSNHSGLRYGILLSDRPKLPFPIPFPADEIPAVDAVLLGQTMSGDLHPQAGKLLNVLAGGEQGSGKSTLLHLFAYSAWRNGWPLYLADPRAMTFDETWNGLSPAPVATRAEDLLEILKTLYEEMDRRAVLFRDTRADSGLPAANLDDYNARSSEKLPRIFVLIDEANTFLDDSRVLSLMTDITRQPRKFGIHFVVAGHNWRDIRKLSSNFHTRLSLRVADDTSASVVLNSRHWGKAMMKVNRPGRGVIFLDGRFQRVQFYGLDDEHVAEMLSGGAQDGPTKKEREYALRALAETDGKVTREVLQEFGLGWRDAGRMLDRWYARGWAAKDPARRNGTYITSILASLLQN